MTDFEKLGAFYIGRGYDLEKGSLLDDVVLYDAKDLTTHALVVGMTGSGKTGLAVVLLEEAAIDGIPALVIDPKGDLGNLLLTFPGLRAQDFRPWIDENEASRKGLPPDAYAHETAETWKQGLKSWGQGPARVSRFRDAADVAIYTPGSRAGWPVDLLRSFAAPVTAQQDPDGLRERVTTAVSGLLGLLGIEGDPIRSREHILLASLLTRAWSGQRQMDVPTLIREIQSPPIDRLGVMDLETFFPTKERLALAMQLNSLLASPAFSSWTEGEPLDIQRLLYTADGRPRIAIFSIAHLSDPERMFFVTLLLNEVIGWMRSLPGTGSLRALLLMDEIFGYFPPTAAPPSKTPMLTLLKQARAYGLGVVLATQNPVDLDYKGLANTGTWFLGRLQTLRDKERVMAGLEGASAGKAFDKAKTDVILSGLGSRTFLMHNVHDDQPVVFRTRWALSFLRGPLTRDQIATLMRTREAETAESAEHPRRVARPQISAAEVRASEERPVLSPGIQEVVLPVTADSPGREIVYRPVVLGSARLHFVSAGARLDHWATRATLVPLATRLSEAADVDWSQGSVWQGDLSRLEKGPPSGGRCEAVPTVATRAASYDAWAKSYAHYLYQNVTLNVWTSTALKESSRPEEDERAFRIRLHQSLREQRDRELERLRGQFAPKLLQIQERIRKAEERTSREESQYSHQKMQTAISLGSTLLGAMLGRKLGGVRSVGGATSTARSVSRAAREREDIERAKQEVGRLRQKLADLDAEFEEKAGKLRALADPAEVELVENSVRPRKSDVSVTRVMLAWTPWRQAASGEWEPAF